MIELYDPSLLSSALVLDKNVTKIQLRPRQSTFCGRYRSVSSRSATSTTINQLASILYALALISRRTPLRYRMGPRQWCSFYQDAVALRRVTWQNFSLVLPLHYVLCCQTWNVGFPSPSLFVEWRGYPCKIRHRSAVHIAGAYKGSNIWHSSRIL